jgi:hypothetical protein
LDYDLNYDTLIASLPPGVEIDTLKGSEYDTIFVTMDTPCNGTTTKKGTNFLHLSLLYEKEGSDTCEVEQLFECSCCEHDPPPTHEQKVVPIYPGDPPIFIGCCDCEDPIGFVMSINSYSDEYGSGINVTYDSEYWEVVPSEVEFKLYDAMGTMLKTIHKLPAGSSANGEFRFLMNDYVSGLYFITAEMDGDLIGVHSFIK